jgi:hypothetical protein
LELVVVPAGQPTRIRDLFLKQILIHAILEQLGDGEVSARSIHVGCVRLVGDPQYLRRSQVVPQALQCGLWVAVEFDHQQMAVVVVDTLVGVELAEVLEDGSRKLMKEFTKVVRKVHLGLRPQILFGFDSFWFDSFGCGFGG